MEQRQGEIDPKLPPASTQVLLGAPEDTPDGREVFEVILHFPRPYARMLGFKFPFAKGNLLDETAEIKSGQSAGLCFKLRDSIVAKLRSDPRIWEQVARTDTNWTQVAAAIQAHIKHWNKSRRRAQEDWGRVVH